MSAKTDRKQASPWTPLPANFSFKTQIPSTWQQPLTNSHCQNEHLSKAISFVKSFYSTNKTLKLLTDECLREGEQGRTVLTIYSHLTKK